MADVTKNGIIVSPGSGSGNTELKVKAQRVNQGNRTIQTATYTVQPQGGIGKTLTANLEAANEFVKFTNGATQAVDKGGGVITITGTSNSTKLTFTKGSGDIVTADIASITYQAAGKSTVNGAAIEGDPGATASYNFTLTLNAAANTTVKARSQQITVKANSTSVTATITLNQTEGDPTLSIKPETITVPQDGSEVSVQVTTNTTFTVS
jgi:hypothetical protein